MLYAFEGHRVQSRQGNSFATASDEELLQEIAKGKNRALEALIARHRLFLLRAIERCLLNPFDSEDVFQQCLLEIWEHASEYDPSRGKAIAWMVTLARRRTIDSIRRRRTYLSTLERYSAEPDTVARESEGENGVLLHETSRIIAQLLARLPESQGEALKMAFIEGLSQRQIALRTGTPMGTVKTRLELGLKKLRAYVESGSLGKDLSLF